MMPNESATFILVCGFDSDLLHYNIAVHFRLIYSWFFVATRVESAFVFGNFCLCAVTIRVYDPF